MAEDASDELQYKMVNGDTFSQSVPAGEGVAVITNLPETGWFSTTEGDVEVRIRLENVVSVRLLPHDDQGPRVY